MKKTSKTTHQFVICIRNEGYSASLEPRKIYETLPDDDAALHSQLRIIDESGEDYLYPSSFFLALDLPDTVKKALRHAA